MDMQLPPDFAEAALARFDGLQADGALFYYPVPGEVVEANNFKFEFKISPSIARKPVLPAHAPERRGRGGPFVDPDPRFVVGRPGPDHVVELSMHAMFRPHYVLHTREFAPQTDDLDAGDLAAAWAVMAATTTDTSSSPMMIYNCGYDGGASQGHKHVQIFAEPQPGFALFPEEVVAGRRSSVVSDSDADADADTAADDDDDSRPPLLRHPAVPFQHFVAPLPARLAAAAPAAAAAILLPVYRRLLARVRAAHAAYAAAHPDDTGGSSDSTPAATPAATPPPDTHRTLSSPPPPPPPQRASTTDYNVVLTPRWMCLVPRRRGGRLGTGAGSLGMLGLLWLRDAAERAHWAALGMTEHLVWMGLPWA